MIETATPPSRRLVRLLAGDATDTITDNAPSTRAYLLNVANGACTKLAEQLASPGLVLPWLLATIGAPAGLTGLLMPAKQVGSLMPQLVVSGAIRHLAQRKWAWVAAGTVQALLLSLMIPAALWLTPVLAGWTIVGLLLAFNVASGCGSVAFQDLTGKTVAEGARGRMLASRASIGGALTLIAGAGMRAGLGEDSSLIPLLMLVGAAALLWAMAALLFTAVPEPTSEPGEGRRIGEEMAKGMVLLRREAGYRRFLIARALLLSVEVATPFYALYGRDLVGGGIADLGYYVLTVGAATVVASPFWGRLADASARRTMVLAGLVGAAAAALALVLPWLLEGSALGWAYGGVFVVLGIAEAGARLGRKTYLIDSAPKDERPLYAAFANTVIGVVAAGFAALGLVVEAVGIPATLAVLGGLALVATLASVRVPEASQLHDAG